MVDLAAHLQLERPLLLGHSLGGIIAIQAALKLEVLGLVLMSTSSRVSSRAREQWRQRAEAAARQGFEAMADVQFMVSKMDLESQMSKLSRFSECRLSLF